jgi:hypothetical protein
MAQEKTSNFLTETYYGESIEPELIDFQTTTTPARAIIIDDLHLMQRPSRLTKSLKRPSIQIVLTCLKAKDLPKTLVACCEQLKLPKNNYRREHIESTSPGCDVWFPEDEGGIFNIVKEYLSNRDRQVVATLLVNEALPDTQLLHWLIPNVNPLSITEPDFILKRKAPPHYFYEVLAFSHPGGVRKYPRYPKRKPAIENVLPKKHKAYGKLGIRPNEVRFLEQMMKEPAFVANIRKDLSLSDCQDLGIHLPKPKRLSVQRQATISLEDFV